MEFIWTVGAIILLGVVFCLGHVLGYEKAERDRLNSLASQREDEMP